MPIFYIQHTTRYSYPQAARYSANQVILYPIKDEWQEVISHVLHVSGDPVISVHRDYFGNEVGTFTLIEPHHELLIDSVLTVKTKPRIKPEITQSTEEQWQELNSKAAILPYGDFLKTEHFDSSDEIQQYDRCTQSRSVQSLSGWQNISAKKCLSNFNTSKE
jgi:transglutaminase-like putative cysteine protease